jgi:serine/threonine protein kinase
LEIACKEISLEHKTEEGRRRVFREVAVLLNKRHYNLTEVLGCFEAGIKRPHPAGGPSPYLYILQPRAVTDMKNWLKGQQFDILGGESEEQHIYRAAILGLTSGLSYLHSEMGGNVVYHRDLKPENILLFKESRLVWKIADFGCANLKPVEKTATKSTRTTKFWAPPEYFFDKDSPKSSTKHARAHDVYSMGCVFLVLVTLIVYGRQTGGFPAPAGILAYDNLIEGVTDDSSDSTTGPPAVFLNSENDTLEWIAKLKDRRKGDPTYGTLANVLKIIEEMLLPYESRMWSWEAEFYLYEATNEWEKESAENGSHFGDHFGHGEDSKKSMSLNKLRVVIQAARETDYSIVFGPAQRAIKWHRTELLGVMKSKNWYQSPPQTSKQLKHRPDVIKNAISTLPPRDRFKNPMFGYQSIGDDIAWKFHDCNVVALCGLSGIG